MRRKDGLAVKVDGVGGLVVLCPIAVCEVGAFFGSRESI